MVLVEFDYLVTKDRIEEGENFKDFLNPRVCMCVFVCVLCCCARVCVERSCIYFCLLAVRCLLPIYFVSLVFVSLVHQDYRLNAMD